MLKVIKGSYGIKTYRIFGHPFNWQTIFKRCSYCGKPLLAKGIPHKVYTKPSIKPEYEKMNWACMSCEMDFDDD